MTDRSAKRSTATHPMGMGMAMGMAMALGTGMEEASVDLVDLRAGSLAKEVTQKTQSAGGVIPVKTVPPNPTSLSINLIPLISEQVIRNMFPQCVHNADNI